MTDLSRSEISTMQERLNKHEREIAENRHNINGNAQIFDIRLGQITKSIEELKNILKWAGGLIITLMISFMSWSALQQYNANEEQKRDLENQIQIIQGNEKAERDRQRILKELREELVSGGTITTTPSNSGG